MITLQSKLLFLITIIKECVFSYYFIYNQGVYNFNIFIKQFITLNKDEFYNKKNELNLKNDEIISKLNNEINNNRNSINNLRKETENKNKKLDELNKIINDTNNELNRLKIEFNNKLKEFQPGEDFIAILFTSNDKKLTYCFPCKTSTLFIKLEEKLYEEFPEYKETENYFLVNGEKVKRFKTLKENNIKNGKPVILVQEKKENDEEKQIYFLKILNI